MFNLLIYPHTVGGFTRDYNMSLRKLAVGQQEFWTARRVVIKLKSEDKATGYREQVKGRLISD